jgi:hypothetical protein
MKCRLTILVIVIGFAPLSVSAQINAPNQTRGRPDTVQREQQRQVDMQMIEQALTTEGRAPRVKQYPPAVLDQIRSDFLQIQVTERQLTKAAGAQLDIDMKLVGQLTGEIRKRSRRLKENLALPQPETQQSVVGASSPVATTSERFRMSLTDLSDLIESFVSNPMFEHTKLFDQKLSDKATGDLDAIIRLSAEIKRDSEKLRKSQDK